MNCVTFEGKSVKFVMSFEDNLKLNGNVENVLYISGDSGQLCITYTKCERTNYTNTEFPKY